MVRPWALPSPYSSTKTSYPEAANALLADAGRPASVAIEFGSREAMRGAS